MDENTVAIPDWVVLQVGTISLQAAAQIEALRAELADTRRQLAEAHAHLVALTANGQHEPEPSVT